MLDIYCTSHNILLLNQLVLSKIIYPTNLIVLQIFLNFTSTQL